MKRQRIAVIFGSRSVEHEVSIITAHQVMRAMDRDKYEVVPIYLSKEGHWFTGKELFELESFKDVASLISGLKRVYISPDPSVRSLVMAGKRFFPRKRSLEIDMVFPLIHGTYGEDGTLQGLLELANIPYVGAGVLGSAVGMDKIIMKAVFKENQFPIVNYIWFSRGEWKDKPDEIIARIEKNLPYPIFVKPANLGSSIGISKVRKREDLSYAMEVASHYDRRLIVEEALEGAVDINCSVLGNEEPIASVCEQPVSWEEFLNYDEKYLRGREKFGMKGAQRRIPAPISLDLSTRIQRLAIQAFQATDCRGVARVDFLVHPEKGQIFLNEINTIPGSISFYLWEASGIKFNELIDRLISLANDAYQDKKKTMYSYDSKLIAQFISSSLKK